MKRNFVIISVILLICSTSAFAKTLPKNAKSKMFTVVGAGYAIVVGKPENTYWDLLIKFNEPQDRSFYIEVEFQNPCSPDEPFLISKNIDAQVKEFSLDSPKFSFSCLEEGKIYKVTVTAYDSASKSSVLDELRQNIRSINLKELAGNFSDKE